MAVLGYIVTGAAVKVSLPTKTPGVWEARIVRAGNLLPNGVDEDTTRWLTERDLIRAIEAESVSAPSASSAGDLDADLTVRVTLADETMVEISEDFDPSELSVEQVLEVLAVAPADEVERILAAEAAGKNRKTIRDWTPVAG